MSPHAQQAGSPAAWIDADHTFDPAYAARLSVNLEALPLGQPESAEEALEVTRQLAVSGAVDLIVLDSAAALVPRMELETSLGEGSAGMQSRVLASGLRKLAAAARSGVVILFLNQTRGGGRERGKRRRAGVEAVRRGTYFAGTGRRRRSLSDCEEQGFGALCNRGIAVVGCGGIRQTTVKRPFRGGRCEKNP